MIFSLDATCITSHNNQAPILSFIPAAHAVQAKNEALCNTGFFTNIGAWYCTDIGNIGDEGRPKPMSEDAESSVNSLMSKFNIDGEITGFEGETGGGRNGVRGAVDGGQNLNKRQTKYDDTTVDARYGVNE